MSSRTIKRTELIAGILLSLVVLFLLIVRAIHAGALWRDECDSVQVARMPTWTDIAGARSSFPALFDFTLRTYTLLFGVSDIGLRCFGLAVGVALIGVAWFNSRLINRQPPLLLLTLAGLNPTFLVWGTTIRGYGMGSVLIVLTLGLTARLLLYPALPWPWIAALLLAFLAAVQSLYFNCVLAAGIALAAMIVLSVRGQFRLALIIAGIGVICAASYISYLMTAARGAAVLLQTRINLASVWHDWRLACGEPSSISPVVWNVIFLGAVIGAAWRLSVIWREKPAGEFDLLLFGVLASVGSLAGQYAFLWFVSYMLHPWYFLALLCLLAGLIDLIVADLCRFRWVRLMRLAFVIVAAIVLPCFAWPKIVQRQSNIDLIAGKLESDATANDLIVINPWYLGVSFNWYYHGTTPWITVPTMNEHRVHRYWVMKAKMRESDPIADVRAAIRQTLESGNRVWIVGGAQPPDQGSQFSLQPAPDPQFGWNNQAYVVAWSMQLGAFLRTHVVNGQTVAAPAPDVNENENVPLLVAQGWRD